MKIEASAHDGNPHRVNPVAEAVVAVRLLAVKALRPQRLVRKVKHRQVGELPQRRSVDHVVQSQCRSISTDCNNGSSQFQTFLNASTRICKQELTAPSSISKPVDPALVPAAAVTN